MREWLYPWFDTFDTCYGADMGWQTRECRACVLQNAESHENYSFEFPGIFWPDFTVHYAMHIGMSYKMVTLVSGS